MKGHLLFIYCGNGDKDILNSNTNTFVNLYFEYVESGGIFIIHCWRILEKVRIVSTGCLSACLIFVVKYAVDSFHM